MSRLILLPRRRSQLYAPCWGRHRSGRRELRGNTWLHDIVSPDTPCPPHTLHTSGRGTHQRFRTPTTICHRVSVEFRFERCSSTIGRTKYTINIGLLEVHHVVPQGIKPTTSMVDRGLPKGMAVAWHNSQRDFIALSDTWHLASALRDSNALGRQTYAARYEASPASPKHSGLQARPEVVVSDLGHSPPRHGTVDRTPGTRFTYGWLRWGRSPGTCRHRQAPFAMTIPHNRRHRPG